MNKKKWLIVAGIVAAIALCAVLVLCLTQCGGRGDTPVDSTADPTYGADTDYTVTVKDDSDKPLSGIGVYIYEGDPTGELVWYDKTGTDGSMTFTTPASDNMVAVLDDIPTGYAAEEAYPITGEHTEIILSAGVLTDEDMESVVYKLGDKILDFTVTDTDGNSHTLSELLKTKKAVILNFWYINCDPCAKEFPYLQEAYEKYGDQIEILAMNPVDRDVSAIADYKSGKGITFPMIMADEAWANMMALTGYPTTVIIDQNGIISLIHKGSIDNTETFDQMFGHFTSEEYESGTVVEDIEEILVNSDVGTAAKPYESGSFTSFQVSVNPGASYYIELYKQSENFYLTVTGGDFTLTHKGKDYQSNNGSYTLYIQPDGVFIPVELKITNTTDKVQTYTLSKSTPAGSYSNPYTLTLGEFTGKVSAGNDQGVYYTYTMPNDGTLTVKCLSSTSGVDYDFILYNLDSYAQTSLEAAGEKDSSGKSYLEIQGRKGQKIQFVLSTLPDSANNYPACTFRLLASFSAGEVKEPYQLPYTDYTVKVVDQDGKAVKNATVVFSGKFTHTPPAGADDSGKTYSINVSTNLTTDANGKATTKQVSGPYTATVVLPEGYKAATSQYSLTAAKPSVTATITKIVQKDYTVTVRYPDGTAVPDVAIKLGSDYKLTDANGTVSFRLDEGQYSVNILQGIPEGFVLPDNATTVAFPEGKSTLELTLVGIGGLENPYVASSLPFTTRTLATDEMIYLRIDAPVYYEDSPVLTIADPNAIITMGGQDYYADPESGIVQVPLTDTGASPELAIGYTGAEAKALLLEINYPVGTQWNPELITSLENLVLSVPEGDTSGYYYRYENEHAGDLTLTPGAITPEGAAYTLTATTVKSGTVTIPTGGASVYQRIGEASLLHLSSTGEGNPAISLALTGSFDTDWDAVPEGQQVYTVTVLKPDGTGMANAMVLINKNSTMVASGLTDANGQVKAMLDAGVYDVELALPTSTTKYYYEDKANTFSLGVFDLTVNLISLVAPQVTVTEGDWAIGDTAYELTEGTAYITLQADVWKYFLFTPTRSGAFRISVSDPDAKLYNSLTTMFPSNAETYANDENTGRYYDIEVSDGNISNNTTFVIAASGTADTLITITRTGDKPISPGETEPSTAWKDDYVPVASAIPTNVSRPTYVDVKDMTAGKYVAVYNSTDRFYHMGTKDGPIIYVNLNDDCPYGSLKAAVVGEEGSNAGGTSFGRYFYDSNGVFLYREVYGNTVREYVQLMRDNNISDGKRFYPLTKNLAHILKLGCAKWWEDPNVLFYESFEGYNPDTVWMFACCTFD